MIIHIITWEISLFLVWLYQLNNNNDYCWLHDDEGPFTEGENCIPTDGYR